MTTTQDNRIQEPIVRYTLRDCIYYINLVKEILTNEAHERLTTSIYLASRGQLTLQRKEIAEEQRHAATLVYEHHLTILRIFFTVLIRDAEIHKTTQSIQRLSLQDD
jgi:hypothetical protein